MEDAAPPGVSGPPGLVVVGASAGGVDVLVRLVSGMPADFPGCVLVVLHVPADSPSALPSILDRAGPLPVRHARDGERLVGGTVLVAPPDRHLVVLDGVTALSRDPRENDHRPAIDVLFRSAARAWGPRVTGVVLSGALDDGAAGLGVVRSVGGRCLVQDPEEAHYASMPAAALLAVPDAEVLAVEAVPGRLSEILQVARVAAAGPVPADPAGAGTEPASHRRTDGTGELTGFGCPVCGGMLHAVDQGSLRSFRCSLGHAWSPDSLLARQGTALEGALWMALRGLEDKVALLGHLRDNATERGASRSADRFERSRVESVDAALLVRRMLTEDGPADDGLEPATVARTAGRAMQDQDEETT